MNTLLKLNGKDVYADRSYSVQEAASIVEMSTASLYLAIKRTDERRLMANIKKSNNRLYIKGADLWRWSESFWCDPRKK